MDISPKTDNRFLVSSSHDALVIMRQPIGPLSREDAFLLAAWLVSMAEVLPGDLKFEDVLNAVQNT
jgi:hypothetical protein